jgi:hypothetical protein
LGRDPSYELGPQPFFLSLSTRIREKLSEKVF